MRRDFVKNGRAQRLHVYCCFMKKRCKKKVRLYINEKSGKYEKVCKLSSKIDVLKFSRAQRLHNYYGLRKNRVDSGPPQSGTGLCFFRAFWCHLADLGRNFWPSWIPRKVQKSCFWVSCWKNYEKRVSENETRKNIKIWLKFCLKMRGFGRFKWAFRWGRVAK